jgi:capsid protein
MDAKQVQIGRITADPTAAFRNEGSTIVASDPTFDNVTLDSKTISALVIGSLEWFQDAPNASQVVEQAIAAAVATQLDLVCLFGGVTTGNEGISLATPPNPRGILATPARPGLQQRPRRGGQRHRPDRADLLQRGHRHPVLPDDLQRGPNALLWNAKLAQQYAKGYDSQGQPLQAPAAVVDVAKFVTNQIPSFTSGTMTSRATDLFVGDFRQLLIGQRLTFTVQTLTERYAELGQIGIVAPWRGDVQLARPRAFAVYRYLQGAL